MTTLPTRVEPDQPYLADDGLISAAEVAVRLGKPLLLTGEAGVGKTQAAYWLRRHLKEKRLIDLPVFEFAVRSTTIAADLYYSYNALSHYHASALSRIANLADARDGKREVDEPEALPYIRLNALGLAVSRASEDDLPILKRLDPDRPNKPTRSIVLLDEIDKAPRDLPNDILRAVERMEMTIPELDHLVVGSSLEHRPIIVATSNSERALPEAFLRRCIYYHIPFPDDRLPLIVKAHRSEIEADRMELLIRIFQRVRDLEPRKKPSTAELLDFVKAVEPIGPNLADAANFQELTLSCLVKTEEDRVLVRDRWKSILEAARKPA